MKSTFTVLLLLLPAACRSGDDTPQLPPVGAPLSKGSADQIFKKIDKNDNATIEQAPSDDSEATPPPIPANPAAERYNFDKVAPVVTCAQPAPAIAGGESFSVVCEAKDAAGQPFKLGSEPLQLKWSYASPANATATARTTAAGEIDSPLSAASFTFTGPNNAGGYYLADTGSYSLELVFTKDGSQKKTISHSAMKMIGEGCGAPDTLSFGVETTGYRLVDPSSAVRVFGGSGGKFRLGSNSSLTTDGANMTFLAPFKSKISDRGAGGTAIIFGGVTYTAEGIPKMVLADKTAIVTAPKEKVFTFASPISYCP